jgi:NAD(P)-dependent dehydrogenase (short-subunit alcohol dehydrogenase family)
MVPVLQVALITGGDSGIGCAIALAYAREGADVAVAYLNEHKDAEVSEPCPDRASEPCSPAYWCSCGRVPQRAQGTRR